MRCNLPIFTVMSSYHDNSALSGRNERIRIHLHLDSSSNIIHIRLGLMRQFSLLCRCFKQSQMVNLSTNMYPTCISLLNLSWRSSMYAVSNKSERTGPLRKRASLNMQHLLVLSFTCTFMVQLVNQGNSHSTKHRNAHFQNLDKRILTHFTPSDTGIKSKDVMTVRIHHDE